MNACTTENSRPQRRRERGVAAVTGQLARTLGSLLFITLSVSACTGAGTGFMDPAGPIAGTERRMFFEIASVTLIVVVPVFVLVPLLLWRYRRRGGSGAYQPDWEDSRRLEWLIWGIPVLIVIALAGFVWVRTLQLDPYRSVSGSGEPLSIQAVALDWKWLFIYPQQGIATVNDLVLPVNRAVDIKLTSATVMQSLHIPNLAGQVYAMAGMTTGLSLRADRVGSYRGRNTQYNGAGFAQQRFQVRVVPATDFTRWVGQAQAQQHSLDASAFMELAQPSVATNSAIYHPVEAGLYETILQRSTQAGAPLGASPRHSATGTKP